MYLGLGRLEPKDGINAAGGRVGELIIKYWNIIPVLDYCDTV